MQQSRTAIKPTATPESVCRGLRKTLGNAVGPRTEQVRE